MTERGEHPIFGSSEGERPIDTEVTLVNPETKIESSVIPEPQDRGEVLDNFPVAKDEVGTIGPRVENKAVAKPEPGADFDLDTLLAKLDLTDIQDTIGELTERNADVPE